VENFLEWHCEIYISVGCISTIEKFQQQGSTLLSILWLTFSQFY